MACLSNILGLKFRAYLPALSKYFKSKYCNSMRIYGVVPAKGGSILGIKGLENKPKWFLK